MRGVKMTTRGLIGLYTVHITFSTLQTRTSRVFIRRIVRISWTTQIRWRRTWRRRRRPDAASPHTIASSSSGTGSGKLVLRHCCFPAGTCRRWRRNALRLMTTAQQSTTTKLSTDHFQLREKN